MWGSAVAPTVDSKYKMTAILLKKWGSGRSFEVLAHKFMPNECFKLHRRHPPNVSYLKAGILSVLSGYCIFST